MAYYLQKLGIPYDLFEGDAQVGGKMRSVKIGEYLLELGPNTIQSSPEIDELIRELKLEQEVQNCAKSSHHRYILRDGVYQQIPATPFSLLSKDFFWWKTKHRIMLERKVKPIDREYETVSQFFERRFGPGVLEYAVSPFVAGLYAGDPDKLLLRKTFPKLKELEQEHGSVLKGLVHSNDNENDQVFSFVEGMHTLPQAIAKKLVSLHTEHQVEMITRSQGKYVISCSTSTDTDTEEYDLLVLALPAYQAAEMLNYTFPGFAAALLNIHYPPHSVVHTAYNRIDVSNNMDGLGVLHPKAEGTFAAGSIWSSSVLSGRCRPHEVLFTTFVGGVQSATHALTEREQLMQQVHQELKELHGIASDKPNFQYMHLWQHSLPQYDLHIEDAHEMAQDLEAEGMFVAANWYSGVSVPSRIRHAKELAYKINLKLPHALNS